MFRDLPNEILAMTTEGGMLEKAGNEFVILNLINVLFLEGALSVAGCAPRFIPRMMLVAVSVIRSGRGRGLRTGPFLVLFVHGHGGDPLECTNDLEGLRSLEYQQLESHTARLRSRRL